MAVVSSEAAAVEVDGWRGTPRCSGKSGPSASVDVSALDAASCATKWFTSQFQDQVVKCFSKSFSKATREDFAIRAAKEP